MFSDFYSCLLNALLEITGSIILVHVGAHVGKTTNDPVFKFISQVCDSRLSGDARCTAILVEPVKHLFEQLQENCRGLRNVMLENVAISDTCGRKPFYFLKQGVDLKGLGLPSWFDQLGSLSPERISA